MFCKNCGKEMRDDARFCPNCGAVNGGPAAGSVPPDAGRQGWGAPAGGAGAAAPAEGAPKRRGLGLVIGAGVAAVAVIALLVVGVSSLFASPRGTVEKAFTKTAAAFEEAGDKLGMPDLVKLQKDRSISGSFRVELTGISSQLVGYDLSDLYGLGLGMRANYSGKDRKMDAQLSAFWDDDELVSFQMLADNANLYLGSSQFTDGSFYGLNTETLGDDLKNLSGDDSVEDISFNLFDLMDIILKATPGEENEKAVKEANKALKAALEVKKTGAKTMDIHGKSTKTTAYHVVIPQDALEDYVDAMEDILSSVDYVSMYEELFQAMGVPGDEIDDLLADLEDVYVYGDLADAVKYFLDELGDVEVDVYLSGGYVSAVLYEERIQGTKVEAALYLGGGDQYVDNLSLEIRADGGELLVESAGNHTGKGGAFTDETTIRIKEDGRSVGRLTSEMRYEPKGKGDNFRWEIGVDSSGVSLGVVEMEGSLALSKDSLDLKLEDVSVRTMGMEVFSMSLEYAIGPCKGMEVSVSSPTMLADMDEADLMDLGYDLQANAQDWALDMQDLFTSRLPSDLLWALMYAF
jgi:hypothetical protein